jgi:hypothetical protein
MAYFLFNFVVNAINDLWQLAKLVASVKNSDQTKNNDKKLTLQNSIQQLK